MKAPSSTAQVLRMIQGHDDYAQAANNPASFLKILGILKLAVSGRYTARNARLGADGDRRIAYFPARRKDQMIPIEDLSVACARWHVASDAYATQLIMLENGRPDAIQELRRLCAQLEECRQAVDALTVK